MKKLIVAAALLAATTVHAEDAVPLQQFEAALTENSVDYVLQIDLHNGHKVWVFGDTAPSKVCEIATKYPTLGVAYAKNINSDVMVDCRPAGNAI